MRAAAIILALAATSAQAEFVSGNELLSRMNGSTLQQINALGYVTGVADSELGISWCPSSPNVSARQVFDITKAMLDVAPESRHQNASYFVMAAVRRAFPCDRKQDSKPASSGKML